MRFGCLGYLDENKWNAMFKSQQDAMIEECFAYDDMLRESGHWVDGGQALQISRTAKTVQWNGNRVVVTDGPHAETHEQLGDYFLIEANNLDEAINIAERIPVARVGTVEIRPVVELTDLPPSEEPSPTRGQ